MSRFMPILGLCLVVGLFFAMAPSSWAQPSDCCVNNGTPGCDNPTCQEIVCGIDNFCCDVFWDGICAGEALAYCGELCGGQGDPGSLTCGEAQDACLYAIAPDYFKNKGQKIMTCAQAANPFLDYGLINEECHSCIVSTVASKKKEGTNCGPEGCVPLACGTYTFDCDPENPNCVCYQVAEGGGACGPGFFCGEHVTCPNGTSDCPDGETCYINTCCVEPKCGPSTCPADAAIPQGLGEGQTSTGQ